jgi:hypothetical protein
LRRKLGDTLKRCEGLLTSLIDLSDTYYKQHKHLSDNVNRLSESSSNTVAVFLRHTCFFDSLSSHAVARATYAGPASDFACTSIYARTLGLRIQTCEGPFNGLLAKSVLCTTEPLLTQRVQAFEQTNDEFLHYRKDFATRPGHQPLMCLHVKLQNPLSEAS